LTDILAFMFVIGIVAGSTGLGLVGYGLWELDKAEPAPDAQRAMNAGLGLCGLAATLIFGVLAFFD
jgi:tellurite resistance protein TehA-like permease